MADGFSSGGIVRAPFEAVLAGISGLPRFDFDTP
jgi:hypothetical protein